MVCSTKDREEETSTGSAYCTDRNLKDPSVARTWKVLQENEEWADKAVQVVKHFPLSYAGKPLDDQMTLADFGIGPLSVLWIGGDGAGPLPPDGDVPVEAAASAH